MKVKILLLDSSEKAAGFFGSAGKWRIYRGDGEGRNKDKGKRRVELGNAVNKANIYANEFRGGSNEIRFESEI